MSQAIYLAFYWPYLADPAAMYDIILSKKNKSFIMNSNFDSQNKTSNEWVARDTKISSSWSTNGKEKDNHFHDYHQIHTYMYIHHITGIIIWMVVLQVVTIIIITITNIENSMICHIKEIHSIEIMKRKCILILYNLIHNYIERKEPSKTCYFWPDIQQVRNYLWMKIGHKYVI